MLMQTDVVPARSLYYVTSAPTFVKTIGQSSVSLQKILLLFKEFSSGGMISDCV